MKEDFLHYVWKFKKFDSTNLVTSRGESITIINTGQYLQLSGPDFFNAQIILGNQKWAGNVEIHVKSSDWYLHSHENDPAYENVILHVVWDHDIAVYSKNNTEIPVLILKDYVNAETVANYLELSKTKSWIYCENYLRSVDPFVISHWQERIFFERLEKKTIPILKLLDANGNDWEATLFSILAKSFGLNTNGEAFFMMANSIPFAVIRKESRDIDNLEALFFGRAGLLENPNQDLYFEKLATRWEYLQHKYNLAPIHVNSVEFFRHRPDNFPTIRLAQLAQLYHKDTGLFSKVIELDQSMAFYDLFHVGVSDYWQVHYQFDRESPKKAKLLSRSFIDLVMINSIIPMKFAFAQYHQKDISERLVSLMASLSAESNSVTIKFASFGIKSENALVSQALLQMKNEYCDRRRCLECAIGSSLMKSGETEKKSC